MLLFLQHEFILKFELNINKKIAGSLYKMKHIKEMDVNNGLLGDKGLRLKVNIDFNDLVINNRKIVIMIVNIIVII